MAILQLVAILIVALCAQTATSAASDRGKIKQPSAFIKDRPIRSLADSSCWADADDNAPLLLDRLRRSLKDFPEESSQENDDSSSSNATERRKGKQQPSTTTRNKSHPSSAMSRGDQPAQLVLSNSRPNRPSTFKTPSVKLNRALMGVSRACRITQKVLIPDPCSPTISIPYPIFLEIFRRDHKSVPHGNIEITDFPESAKKIPKDRFKCLDRNIDLGASRQQKISWWLDHDRYDTEERERPSDNPNRDVLAPEQIDNLFSERTRLAPIKLRRSSIFLPSTYFKSRFNALMTCIEKDPLHVKPCFQDRANVKGKAPAPSAEQAALIQTRGISSASGLSRGNRMVFSTNGSRNVSRRRIKPPPQILSINCEAPSSWMRKYTNC